jgi:hypothetical protein
MSSRPTGEELGRPCPGAKGYMKISDQRPLRFAPIWLTRKHRIVSGVCFVGRSGVILKAAVEPLWFSSGNCEHPVGRNGSCSAARAQISDQIWRSVRASGILFDELLKIERPSECNGAWQAIRRTPRALLRYLAASMRKHHRKADPAANDGRGNPVLKANQKCVYGKSERISKKHS